MPLVLSSLPPSSSTSPENSRQNMRRVTSRPVLATLEPSPAMRRPALAEKPVPRPSSKTKPTEIENEKPHFPSATIGVESISDVMAARLVTCLLGHVLFLKSQVPFPVAQLMKMAPSRHSDEPRNKKMEKLLESFDVLSSHLGSTFTALASALASASSSSATGPRLEKAHLAIVLGPTATAVNAARARIVLEVDGLRVQAPRTSSDVHSRTLVIPPNTLLKENDGIARSVHVSRSSGPLRDPSKRIPLAPASFESSDAEDRLDSGTVDGSPDSDCESDVVSSESDSEFESDSVSESGADADASDDDGYGETESDLRDAERLLSRTLAIANADPMLGMAAEIRPTQTHILLRAPRRFSHPSWIPRHDMERDMDPFLREFDELPTSGRSGALKDTTSSPKESDGMSTVKKLDGKRRGRGGIKTDYVRVRSRGGEEPQGDNDTHDCVSYDDETEDNEGDDNGHKDEMIWWSWDGKLEGFADI